MNKRAIIAKEGDELAEPFFDATSEGILKGIFGIALPEFAKDLPLIKYVKTAVDMYSAHKLSRLQRRMKAFLDGLTEGSFEVKDFEALSDDEQRMIIDILITELDTYANDFQSEALSLLFMAFIKKDIDRLMFQGVSHELKNINPLAFYFNVDGFSLKELNSSTIRIRIDGPLHYLPSTFYSTQSEGLISASELYLTSFGKIFFEYIYEPMRQKYTH